MLSEDTAEPVKIDKSKKGEKRNHQNEHCEEMLKLRAALEGKLRSNQVLGNTVSKSVKAQKRQKLANKKLRFDDADNDVTAGKLTKPVSTKRIPKIVSGDDGGESEGSEDEFYKQEKQKQLAKRAAKAEIYSREPSSIPSLPETVDGKRLISREMSNNRGLTRQRNKDLKNPRKKYRTKHEDKVKRRGGQFRGIRKQEGHYGGEAHGINAYTSKSIRIKN